MIKNDIIYALTDLYFDVGILDEDFDFIVLEINSYKDDIDEITSVIEYYGGKVWQPQYNGQAWIIEVEV
tara:strand:+ start:10503 stop:10709 length:207 start_codon:yes stop_codon:yes gene_type:complete